MKPEIKNLKKAAKRILKAIKGKERIIIYGDADMDGVSSAVILQEAVKDLGGNVADVYFPDRENEGYGVTEKGLNYLKKHSPALFITLDCGIGSFKEVEMANEMGFEVIIIDHHEVLEKLPKASIIVDPKQKGDKYPFKYFANVGLAFKLSEALLGRNMTESLRKSFLELTAMATIADMMPQTDDNEEMIIQGLKYIESSWRPGIQASFELKEFKGLTLLERVYKVNSLLNIRDVKNRLPAAYRLLTASSKSESQKLAKSLIKKGIEKKERVKKIIEEIEKRVFKKDEPIIFEGDAQWELSLLGVAASILIKSYKKPIFLYKRQKEESQGGIRAPSEFDVVEAMKTCSDFLITYGGHKQAAGFRLRNEDLDKFRECLIKHFK